MTELLVGDEDRVEVEADGEDRELFVVIKAPLVAGEILGLLVWAREVL